MDWQVLGLAAVAAVSGIVYAVYGWVDSGEPFNRQAFLRSCKAAIVSAVVLGLGYRQVPIVPSDYLLAIASGFGITAVGSKMFAK